MKSFLKESENGLTHLIIAMNKPYSTLTTTGTLNEVFTGIERLIAE